jgi:hypothetical protein
MNEVTAEFAATKISSKDYTLFYFGKASQGGSNLTSIASHRLALVEFKVASGVEEGELVGERIIRLKAVKYVFGRSRYLYPARSAVGLVTMEVYGKSTLEQVVPCIEYLRSRDRSVRGQVMAQNL